MRKALVVAALVGMIGSFGSAEAAYTYRKYATFKASPCAVACSYWIPNAPGQPKPPAIPADPTTWDPTSEEITTDDEVLDSLDSTDNACRKPSPAGSFADLVVTAPKYTNFLELKATPSVDWDLFICAKPSSGNNGALLASGANDASDADCTVGCAERAFYPTRAGRKYVLRAYNWSDPADLRATYTFRRI